MRSMLLKWLRLTQELKENPGCHNNRGYLFPASIEDANRKLR
jgi:hypothetical protein